MTSSSSSPSSPSTEAKKPLSLKFVEEDNGSCRVYYRSPKRNLYCFQLDTKTDFTLYYCSKDGEPEVLISLDRVELTLDKMAPEESRIGEEFNTWYRLVTAEPSAPGL